MTVRLQG
jgi:hypothetical protein